MPKGMNLKVAILIPTKNSSEFLIRQLRLKNIAIIPMREGSNRIPPKKNLDFFGKPMFLYTYEAAIQSELFEEVLISTDSQEIIKMCDRRGIDIPFRRPDNLSTDHASLNDVCLHALEEMANTQYWHYRGKFSKRYGILDC